MPHFARALQERVLAFSVQVSRLTMRLPRTPLGIHLSRQLLRCGTSPAANYAEAQAAESKQDFIHKNRICLKELRESACWIQMIMKAELLPESRLSILTKECEELIKIIAKSIVTAKTNSSRKMRQAE